LFEVQVFNTYLANGRNPAMLSPRWFSVCVLLGLAIASTASGREWHRADGSKCCDGKLLAVENGQAKLLADSGETLLIPLEDLSLEDAGFVQLALQQKALLTTERVSVPLAQPVEPQADAKKTPSAGTASQPDSSDMAFPLTNPDSTTWQVRPDPAVNPWRGPADPELVAKVPVFSRQGFALPSNPSPFVAISSAAGDYNIWDLWDLRDGMRRGVARGVPRQGTDSTPAISANGKYLAVMPQRASDMVEIWSFESGKRVSFVDQLDRSFNSELLEFVVDDGVLLHLGRGKLAVYDATTGKLRCNLPNGYFDTSSSQFAISPGGHYVAITQSGSERVGLIDTRNGAVAADLLLPQFDTNRWAWDAVAFSADGSRVMLLLHLSRRYRLVVWNVRDGTRTMNIQLSAEAWKRLTSSYRRRSSQWLPIIDTPRLGGVLLKGNLLVDAETGSAVWGYLPGHSPTTQPIHRLIGESQMLELQEVKNGLKLVASPIPIDEIRRSRAIVAAGGSTQDINLPPLTQANLEQIERRQVIESSLEAKYEPAGPTPTADVKPYLTFVLTSASDPPLNFRSNMRSLAFSDRQHALCAILAERSARAGQDGSPWFLDIYSLATGERKNRLKLPLAASLLDLSPDGARALVASTDDGRIDVWNGESGEHQLGFRPGGLREPPPTVAQQYTDGFPIAFFVGNEQILTTLMTGEIVLWSMDGLRPLYSRASLPGATLAIDASRRYFLAQDERGLNLCLVDTGRSVASIKGDHIPAGSIFSTAAFRENGEEVAILLQAREGSHLVIWKIGDDKFPCEMQFPYHARQVAWSGDDVLLGEIRPTPQSIASSMNMASSARRGAGGAEYERRSTQPTDFRRVNFPQMVVRVRPEEQRVIWTYQADKWQLAEQTFDQRAWLMQRKTGTYVLAISPGRSAIERQVIAERPPRQLAKVAGESIALGLDVAPLPATISRAEQRREEIRTSLTASLTKRLAEYTLHAATAPPNRLRVSLVERGIGDLISADGKTSLSSSGELFRFSRGDGNGILARLELLPDNEEPIWFAEAWFSIDPRAGGGTATEPNLQALVPWERAINWIEKEPLPSTLLDATRFTGLGSSELVPVAADNQ
jgi:WD40 repeat protein